MSDAQNGSAGEWNSMKRYGMGQLGELVTARPRGLAVVIALITIAAAAILSGGIGFNGDLASLLKADTPNYRALQQIEDAFHPFSTDEVIVVESRDLGDADAYAAVREYVTDLQLVDGVAAVMSIFALTGTDGGIDPFLASEEASSLSPADRLDALHARHPLAADMLSQDRSMTLIVLMAEQDSVASETQLTGEALAEISELAAGYANHFSITIAGIGAIHRSIEAALKSDLLLLATVATCICIIVALIVFRSWRSALICAIPPVTGTVWFFAFAIGFDIRIDTITTIIPVLLIIVGFADAVHLHFAWLRIRTAGVDPRIAIRRAFAGTAPACFLTSLTTGIACLGTGLAGSPSLNAFAWAGFTGMFIQLAAVLTIAPLLTLWLGAQTESEVIKPPLGFSTLACAALHVARRPLPIVLLTGALFAGLVIAHLQLTNGFRLSEHLQEDGELRQLETRLVDKGLVSGQLFVRVDDADGKTGFGLPDAARLEAAIRAIWPEKGTEFAKNLFPAPDQIDNLSAKDQPILRRFIARDKNSYLLPVPIDLSMTSNEIVARSGEITERLGQAGLADATDISGLPLLSAVEVPVMIDDLRIGFFVALVLVMVVLVHATGSLRLGLISLAPNLTPILGVEAWLWATGQQLSMTAAVALTIAFGIAVDDSIHVLNRFQLGRADGIATAMDNAIRDTTPPIAASTFLLIAGLAVTQVSSLPSAAVFGQMVTAALIAALFASLFMLPAHIEVFARKK